MRRHIGITFCSVFFLAMLIIESYCLLELRNDYITLIGVSIICLISAYLLVSTLRENIKKFMQNDLHNNFQYEEANKLRTATYVAIKKMEILLEERMRHMEEINISCIDELIASFNDTIKPMERFAYEMKEVNGESSAEIKELVGALAESIEKLAEYNKKNETGDDLLQ